MNENKRKSKVCFVSTISWPLNVYMGPHIKKISETNYVILVADGVEDLEKGLFPSVRNFFQVKIQRKINLFLDISALINLYHIFKSERPFCVHSIMPKAGLLAMMAAAIVGVPVRIHTFTGQIWANRTGIKRLFLMFIDKTIASLATSVITDSNSQREFLIANKIVKSGKISVLCNGSVVGVNTNRFRPNEEVRIQNRMKLGIAKDDLIFLFVGRLSYEKGISDLINAFSIYSENETSSHLLLVGPDEGNFDLLIEKLPTSLKHRIHRIGFTNIPENFMAMADVICLPSYREGFGSVLIEGASVGLPAIASRIYGISDAVVDGVTGILHEAGNIQEIINCMYEMKNKNDFRKKMGLEARSRAITLFSEEILTSEFQKFYYNNGV